MRNALKSPLIETEDSPHYRWSSSWRITQDSVWNKTMVIVEIKSCCDKARFYCKNAKLMHDMLWTLVQNFVFFIWRFLSSVLCNFLHGSAGIKKKLQVAQSQIYSQIGQFSRILVPGLRCWRSLLKIHHTSWIFSLCFQAFIKTNYVDNYLRFHALKPAANIKPTVHREFVEF